VAITLGKDGTISVGSSVTGVRNVQLSTSARTIDVEEFGSRFAAVYSTGREATLSMEVNDDASLSNLVTAHNNGTLVTVSGGVGAWSFPAVITAITENASIDGVVTFQVEAKLTRSGLRA
jgi:hypothetical protein